MILSQLNSGRVLTLPPLGFDGDFLEALMEMSRWKIPAMLIADLMDGMQLDMDLVVDFPDLVFCDDCMAAVRRMAATLVVDEKTLAMETIKAVGQGAHFLVRIIPSSTFARNCGCPGCWNAEIGIYGKKTALWTFSKLLKVDSMNCWSPIRNLCCRQKSKIKSMRLSGRHRIRKLILPNPDPPEFEN
jgi:hypothetical protein